MQKKSILPDWLLNEETGDESTKAAPPESKKPTSKVIPLKTPQQETRGMDAYVNDNCETISSEAKTTPEKPVEEGDILDLETWKKFFEKS